MENIDAAVGVTAATWNQWVGATLRQAHAERLRASARHRRRCRSRSDSRRGCPANLLWMLAASAVGFCLLHL